MTWKRGRLPSVTTERVLEIIQQRGPIEQRAIARIFRRGRSGTVGGKDKVSRQVADCMLQLHQESKIVPTEVSNRLTVWNSI